MKKIHAIGLAVLVSFALGRPAHADGLALTAGLGLPSGAGLDLTYRLSPHFNLRAGGGLPTDVDAKGLKVGDVKYDMNVKLGGFNAFVDWHPFAGNFHLSGGVMSVRDPWTFTAASASSYKINGTSYTSRDVGKLSGETRFGHDVAPIFLVGWGNPVRAGKRWGVVLDLGLAYVGKEEFVLRADGPLAGDPSFQRDLAAEQREHGSDHSFAVTVKVGVSYQF